jgi:hypothetical protein
MKTKFDLIASVKSVIPAILIAGILGLTLQATALGEKAAAAKAQPKQAQPKQKEFETPEKAADALVQAAASFDVPALKEILGPGSEDIIATEDPVMDKERVTAFAAKANAKKTIEIDPKEPDLAILSVGEDDFPLPIPIVEYKGKWAFDTQSGREEILRRRVGANELDAIEICRGFVEAQHEYAAEKRDGAKVNQYAQKVISTPGKQDGLAWQNAEGKWEGPIGEEIAKAVAQGYKKKDKPQPYHGYYFKILKGQGPAAPLGQMDFVVKGAMIGGFALAAAPAQYRVTGVKTFIVSHTGIVYEKDLGKDTLGAFEKMDRYNPDKSWKPVEEE